MYTISPLRRALTYLALTLAGLGVCTPPAQASINDFIAVYKQIESAAPSGTLPVSSQQIVTYEDLFTCAEGGTDIVVCTKEFHDTQAGQQATADIPEGVWQGVYAYVAWKDGDTWGVVEHLGAAAACAVLQVLAGGYDVCGLMQDLYDAAVEAYDTAKWVAKFFVSLGEAAWSGLKAVGCELASAAARGVRVQRLLRAEDQGRLGDAGAGEQQRVRVRHAAQPDLVGGPEEVLPRVGAEGLGCLH
jgi:hypothetical protein